MALMIIEGFEGAGTSGTPTFTQYSFAGANWSLQTGRTGGKCLQVATSSASHTVDFGISGSPSQITIGFALNMGASSSTSRLLGFKNTTNTGLGIYSNLGGALALRRNTSIIATGSTALSTGTWYYIELKADIGSSSNYELRINGATELSGSGVDTRAGAASTFDAMQFQGVGSGFLYSLDDLYLLNNTGSLNNTFLGSNRVVLVPISGDSGTVQWTPNSGGVHHNRVSDNPVDSDTTYNESSTSGQYDLYSVTEPDLGGIRGVHLTTVVKCPSGSPNTVYAVCKSGATTSDGTVSGTIPGSYQNYNRLLESDPNTSALWTDANLTAANFGVKTG